MRPMRIDAKWGKAGAMPSYTRLRHCRRPVRDSRSVNSDFNHCAMHPASITYERIGSSMVAPHKYDPEQDEMLRRAREVIERSHELIAKSRELERQTSKLMNERGESRA
jgi:hypothetical protein